MRNQELHVGIKFDADVAAAQKNLQILFNSLNEISNLTPQYGMKISDDLARAITSAKDLKMHLTNAMDIKTGNLNLDKFQLSLKHSNQTLSSLTSNLMKAGPAGQQSFLALQRAVAKANTKFKDANNLLTRFADTLKNTVRWQLSSTLVHGFMSALQGAITYAQNLDKSLNNIRIVTQKSSEDMAKFAAQANKAAQALSTTTTAYTDASLIYYQQGLSDKEVEKRTNVTIKLANVTQQSTTDISSQLTAIWNNFGKGAENLEYYADVITALGAATASSSKEIAEGLQKFASIADTVGLSYEYATAALATVVAKTRESADVVGTSFKTIFARLQGLSLGETLEDGVNLTKYSKELKKVGVEVLDASGQLRTMDNILNDLGARWNELTAAQKTALAETVGGMRQYAKFMALMENWNDVQQNINIAKGSEGTVQKQADIYAQSWEASQKRVKAALEALYNELIPTDFIKGFNDAISKVINGVTSVMKILGGLPGVLLMAVTILSNRFGPELTNGIEMGLNKFNLFKERIQSTGGLAQFLGNAIKNIIVPNLHSSEKAASTMKNQFQQIEDYGSDIAKQSQFFNDNLKNTSTKLESDLVIERERLATEQGLSEAYRVESGYLAQIDNINGFLALHQKEMTQEQQQRLAGMTDELGILAKLHAEEEERLAILREEAEELLSMSTQDIYENRISEFDFADSKQNAMLEVQLDTNTAFNAEDQQQIQATFAELLGSSEQIKFVFEDINGEQRLFLDQTTGIQTAEENFIALQQMSLQNYTGISQLNDIILHILNDQTTSEEEKAKALEEQISKLEEQGIISEAVANDYRSQLKTIKTANMSEKDRIKAIAKLNGFMSKTATYAKKVALAAGNSKKNIDAAAQKGKALSKQMREADKASTKYSNKLQDIKKKIEKIANTKVSPEQGITTAIQGFSQLAMGINSVANAFKTLADEDASFFDKLTAVAMGLSMAISGINGATKLAQGALTTFAPVIGIVTTAISSQTAAFGILKAAKADDVLMSQLSQVSTEKNTAADLAQTLVKKGLIAVEQKEAVTKALEAKASELGRALTLKETLATIANTIAKKGETASRGAGIVAKIADTVANWALQASMSPVLLITLLLTAAMIALTAIILTVVMAVKAITAAYNADANAAANAEAAAASLAEAYKETKQAYEDLQAALADYKDGLTALEKLTKGTREWRDQLRKTNEQAVELLQKYPKLKEFASYDENGILRISEEGMSQVLEEESARVDSAYATSLMANAKAKEMRNIAEQTQFKRDKDPSVWAGIGAGAAAGSVSSLGLALGGPVTGALVGGIVAGVQKANFNQKIDEAIQQYADNDELTGKTDEELAQLFGVTTDLIPAIRDLGNDVRQAADAFSIAAEEATHALLADNTTVQNSTYSDDVGIFASDDYENAYSSAYEEELKKAKSRGLFNTGTDASKAVMDEYARNAGLYDLKGFKVTNYKGNGTVEYKYIDDEGKEQKKIVTAEEIAAMNASKRAEQMINEAGEKAAAALDRLDATTEAKVVALKKDDTSNLSIQELNSGVNINDLSKEDLEALDYKPSSDSLTIEEMRAEFAQQMAKQAEAAKQAIIDAATHYGGQDGVVAAVIKDAINNTNTAFANLSQAQISAYTNALGHIMYAGGDAAATQFNAGLESLMASHADSASDIMNIANSIDWTAADAMDQFNSQLAQAGIQIDKNSEAWKQMAEGIGKIQPKIEPRDYETVRKQFIELKSLAEKIKIGSIISDADYEKLIATDKKLASLFTRTLDGYTYVGSQNLSQVVQESFRADTLQGLANARDMNQAVGITSNSNSQNSYWNANGSKIKTNWTNAAKSIRGEIGWTKDDGSHATGVLNADWFAGLMADEEQFNALLAAGGGILSADKFKELQQKMANRQDLSQEEKDLLATFFDNVAAAEETWTDIAEMQKEGLTQLGSSYESFGAGVDAIRVAAEEYEIDNKALNDAVQAVANAAILKSTNLDELDSILNEIAAAGVEQDYNTIAAALMNMASQYKNCTAEVEKYQIAMRSGNTEALKAAEDQLRASILLGEAAEKYGLDANVLESQTRSIQALNDDMELNAETAAQMAIANQRMNKGIDTLSDNFEDWTKKLKTATHGSMDYAEVAAEIEGALKDLLGLSDNFELPEGFLDSKENLKLLEEAANGSQLAINKLGIQMVKGAMDITSWDQALIDAYNATAATDKTMSEFTMDMQTAFDTANAGMQAIQDNIIALTNGSMTLSQALDGVDLNEEDWIKSLNEMAVATGMSVEEMRSMLNSMGVRANVEIDYVKQRTKVPTYTEVVEPGEEVTYYDSEGQPQTRRGWKHYTVPGDPIEVEGSVPVPHISINDDDLAAHTISEKTISFSGVGGGKTGGGISHSKTTNGKKSGSSSSKEKKDKKSAEKETERYHEITALIEDYTRELDKAGKAKDRAFGPKKLKAMQAEIAAQAQLNAATEEHIREIREWLEIDKARIAAQGATFDEYGNISNYTELMQQHIDAYNAAVAAYNASEQSDADKEAMEAADKAYQDFIDQLSQYEETNDLLQDKLDELIEAQQAKYDKEFEMLQYTIEFKIEADDSILSYLDYMKNKIENFNDGVHDAVEMLATLNDEASALMDKNSTYNSAIDDTLNHYLSNKGMGESDIQAFVDRFKSNNMSESDMSMLEDMTEAEYQYLLGLKDNLLEINNSLIENMNAVVETVQNSFSKTAEDLDKATRPIERAASALENYAAIIDIVGRDALGITDAIAAELDNAAVAVAHSATVAAKAKVDTLQSERDEVQRLYDEAMAQGLTEMAYKWKTVLEEMDDEIASATDDFNSKWQEELAKAREAFENTVERIKQSMLDAFAGSIGSWSALKDSLEYAKTAADRFVPQYKEIYELSKLNRDIMKSIDNTSNIKNKQALRDLQKEINELEQHSGEISQYDLDNARRRYELELARLQLEEARDAKSTVRLSKDAEGNWSYIYTANQDDIEKAEQDYEDKLYAMQQANNEYINSLSDQILELEEQYAEKLAEIRLDNTMSEEERNAAIERLNAYFAEQMEYLTNEGQKAVDNNARLFEEEWTAYHNWTDAFGNDVQARIDNQHDFMTQFGDTILGTYTGYGNFDELNTAMVRIAEEASMKMEEAYSALQAQVATAMEAAGIDVAHFGEVVHDTVNNQIVPSAQAAEDAVVEMGKAAVDEFKELTDGVSAWQTKYATEMQKIIKKNEKLAKSVNNLATAYANLVTQMYAAAEAPAPKVPKFGHGITDGYINDDSDSSESGDFDDEGGGGATTPNWVRRQSRQKPSKDAAYKSYHETLWHDINGVKSDEWRDERHLWTGSPGIGGYSSATCDYCGMQVDLDPKKPYAIDDKGHILIPGYDTGGYTGNWNSSQGKLAVLHEKELVLNKDDTKNILGTVEMVRKLSQKIDLNAQTARYAFNYHPIINDPKPIDRELQVDQTVSITAEFPNVQNRTEIEEAFTTLINQASQFANRKS